MEITMRFEHSRRVRAAFLTVAVAITVSAVASPAIADAHVAKSHGRYQLKLTEARDLLR
jgi:hypothetical protein